MNILILSSSSRYSDQCVGGAEVSLQLIAEKMALLDENIFLPLLVNQKFRDIEKRKSTVFMSTV